jgi:hypothetical protein
VHALAVVHAPAVPLHGLLLVEGAVGFHDADGHSLNVLCVRKMTTWLLAFSLQSHELRSSTGATAPVDSRREQGKQKVLAGMITS